MKTPSAAERRSLFDLFDSSILYAQLRVLNLSSSLFYLLADGAQPREGLLLVKRSSARRTGRPRPRLTSAEFERRIAFLTGSWEGLIEHLFDLWRFQNSLSSLRLVAPCKVGKRHAHGKAA